ncbi:MAG: electron transfer flavoprotein subunit alpha/FixB family protein, partial [Chloroflexota bacterium]|nr:electron transfer flavoprotein subunit alpha/FixB family protein [Chloroflexota bacterium]
MADNKGVMIVGEIVEGKLAAITAELLGGGRKLADALGEELSAVVMGSGVADLAKEAVAFGADKVYVVDDALLADYRTDSYVAAMEKVIKEVAPNIVLMGQTATGRDLAPRLAFRLDTATAMDCLELAIDPNSKLLLMTRSVYGGNAMGTYVCEGTKPQIATVRAKAMDPMERDDSRSGEVVTIDAGVDASAVRTSIAEKVKEEVEGIKLEDAEVIICGGRGIGGPEPFKDLEELAKALGGAVGATRPPCDNGWVPSAMQVGLTGKIVSPTLYIAVALSGASQHLAGCSGSKNIVAINKDPEANIFNIVLKPDSLCFFNPT